LRPAVASRRDSIRTLTPILPTPTSDNVVRQEENTFQPVQGTSSKIPIFLRPPSPYPKNAIVNFVQVPNPLGKSKSAINSPPFIEGDNHPPTPSPVPSSSQTHNNVQVIINPDEPVADMLNSPSSIPQSSSEIILPMSHDPTITIDSEPKTAMLEQITQHTNTPSIEEGNNPPLPSSIPSSSQMEIHVPVIPTALRSESLLLPPLDINYDSLIESTRLQKANVLGRIQCNVNTIYELEIEAKEVAEDLTEIERHFQNVKRLQPHIIPTDRPIEPAKSSAAIHITPPSNKQTDFPHISLPPRKSTKIKATPDSASKLMANILSEYFSQTPPMDKSQNPVSVNLSSDNASPITTSTINRHYITIFNAFFRFISHLFTIIFLFT